MENPRNLILEKALAVLAHPLTLAAAGLLLVNDLLLRWRWPSWWTGKLSDIAWLVIVPPLLAAAIAVVLPGLVPARHERLRGWLAIAMALALPFLGFVLVKTLPVVNSLATRSFAMIFGAAPSLARNPSDLLALPALLIPAWLWFRAQNPAGEPSPGSASSLSRPYRAPAYRAPASSAHASNAPASSAASSRPRLGLTLLPLIIFALLADAPAPDFGFTCFQAVDGRVYAKAGYQAYVSADGGLTWQNATPGTPVDCQEKLPTGDAWQQVSGPSGQLYRYRPDVAIQRSTDGGQTWQAVRALTPVSEPERFYLMKIREGSPIYRPGPLDGLADPATGNMIFAMGQQGVLVHTTQGDWVWGAGGAYESEQNFPDGNAFLALLGPVMYLALGLALLIYATLALRWTRNAVRGITWGLAWLAWLAVDLVFPPPVTASYGIAAASLGILAVALLVLPLAVEQTFRLARRAPRQIPLLAALALGGGVLYFLPYLLWLYGYLPTFDYATTAGLVLAAVVLACGFWLTGQKTLVPPFPSGKGG